jgi:hypothetical protein
MNELLETLMAAAQLAGYEIPNEGYDIRVLPAGMDTHEKPDLPQGMRALYFFKYDQEGRYLKVGKVNTGSGNRFKYQHYLPNANGSTLARSINQSDNYAIQEELIGAWIQENTTRVNIFFPIAYSERFLSFAEKFLVLALEPEFEDGRR